MSAKASGSERQANGSAQHRSHHDGSSGRAYTTEQKATVIRIRRCSPTAFYDILGLEEVKTTCGEGEIKKAYRKLSLLTHPDKNGYDGADEAFKMVSRAFQVLSDSDKKAKFDRFGGDPDNRFNGASASSPFSGFARSPGGGGGGASMFEEEISPEEMFRQFFGGGGGMGPFGPGFGFDAGPQFVFNFGGGPGFRVHQFGGHRPRRRPGDTSHQPDPQPQSAISVLSSLLPLLLLFIFPLLSSLFGSWTSTPPPPSFRTDRAASPFTQQHTSYNLKIPYWVNPNDVSAYSNRDWRNLDKIAEHRHVGNLNTLCENEQIRRQQLVNEAYGWFWTDEEKLAMARGMDMPGCRKLEELNRRR